VEEDVLVGSKMRMANGASDMPTHKAFPVHAPTEVGDQDMEDPQFEQMDHGDWHRGSHK